ncbi:MAG: DinB family protein [Nonlabens sp.]
MAKRSDLSSEEYSPYFKMYLDLIDRDMDHLEVLEHYKSVSLNFIEAIEKDFQYSYAPGKWTIAQVIMHNIDTERVFNYRALSFLRGSTESLAGFDQDVFVGGLDNYAFAKAELLSQFTATRDATIELFKYCTETQLARTGIASGKTMSARVLPFLIAGHHLHHEKIIKERYL